MASGECTLQSVFFEFDNSDLPEAQRRIIEQNRDCMEKLGGKVKLEGHCDPRGTTEYNLSLGDRRARTVAGQLKVLGGDPDQVSIVSKGEEDAAGTSEEDWVKDRRVDFK
jgi:peptidoglycan-associated lipoprotein